MATAESVKAKIQGLIDTANEATGNTDTDLTTAVGSLVAGYGAGSSGGVKCVDVDITVEASTTAAVTYTVADQSFKSAIENQTKWSVFNGGELYLYKITPKEYTSEATGNTTRVFKNAVGIIGGHTNYILIHHNKHSFGNSGSLQSSNYGIYPNGSIACSSATDGVANFNLTFSVRHDSSGNYEVRAGTYNIQIWYMPDFAWEIG